LIFWFFFIKEKEQKNPFRVGYRQGKKVEKDPLRGRGALSRKKEQKRPLEGKGEKVKTKNKEPTIIQLKVSTDR
jgi:hypothetical protein